MARGKDQTDWTRINVAVVNVTGKSVEVALNRGFVIKALRTAEEYRDSSSYQLVAGLPQLRDTAKRSASQDANELVQRFGEMGRRKFHLAA